MTYIAESRDHNTQLFCNHAEPFFREINHLLIFHRGAVTFNQALRGEFPNIEAALFHIKIPTIGSFKRSIKFKRKKHNGYWDYQFSFPFLDLSPENRDTLHSLQRENNYMVVLVSNTEMTMFGNHREPATVEIQDKIQDSGKGADNYNISIKGETIMYPRIERLSSRFRVLFFIPRLA